MSNPASFALRRRNPDVLTCIANLSNDEVFTPPEFANRMLDTLAEAWAANHQGANIWADKTVKFLDPCTKSGVFLREITSRLNKGLEQEIPDLQERVDHILTQQVPPRGGKVGGCLPVDQPEPIRSRMLLVNTLRNRTASTWWNAREVALFGEAGLGKLTDEDFAEQIEPLTTYYAASLTDLSAYWKAGGTADFRRRDLATLLRNWPAELDRARGWLHWRNKKFEADNAGRFA